MIPALGMIETLGLVPLLNALDAALKSANVKPISGGRWPSANPAPASRC